MVSREAVFDQRLLFPIEYEVLSGDSNCLKIEVNYNYRGKPRYSNLFLGGIFVLKINYSD